MAEEKQRYRITFKCECGNVFKKLTTNPDLTNPPCPECKKANKKTIFHRLGDGPVPASEKHAETQPRERPAPNTIYKCKECQIVARVYEDVGETVLTSCPSCDSPEIKFCGKISKDIPSESTMKNKCVDKTADIVMTDYKMGDLKDNVRIGESMAPKLEPKKQAAADAMFAGARRNAGGINTAALAKRAMAGQMRDRNFVDPVKALHTSETRGR